MGSTTNKKVNIWLILSACLVAVCITFFVFIAVRYLQCGGFAVDNVISNFSVKIRSNFLTGLFKVVTHFGSFITIGILTFVMAVVIKPVLIKIFAVANIGLVGAFCLVVKYIVKRPRPVGVNLIQETGYSFPSAHAMISVVFYGFLIFLILKYLNKKSLKIVLSIVFAVMALIIGYTRVYLGVHFATDVVAGMVAGIAYLTCAILVFLLLEKKLTKRGNNE